MKPILQSILIGSTTAFGIIGIALIVTGVIGIYVRHVVNKGDMPKGDEYTAEFTAIIGSLLLIIAMLGIMAETMIIPSQ